MTWLLLPGLTSLAITQAENAWKWCRSFRPIELSLTRNVAVWPSASENDAWPILTGALVRLRALTAITFLCSSITLVVT